MSAMQRMNQVIGEQLARSGRMAVIEVRGRTSGRAIRTPVGFVEDPDGTVVVGAGSAAAHWPRNLIADPRCRISLRGTERAYVATEIHDAARAAAVAAIQAKYGAPAARVGTGPVFRLAPVDQPAEGAA